MLCHTINGGLPHSPVSEESACNAGDLGSIPGSGGSSGEGHGNPLQCSHLENPMDRGAWQAIGDPVVKNPPSNAGDTVSFTGLGRFHRLWGS